MNEVTLAPEGGLTTSASNWELAQRQARAFAASDMVPQQYRNNVPNCLIALEMAHRMNASPLMVAQNLYLVHGNPGWSSKFLIACFNQCGRFSSLRYEWNKDRTGCRAWAVEKATNERIDGPLVSMDMAKAEGWSTKNGSKWKSMPELMLMYRAAAFLIRTYAPEISMGLQTDDELRDIAPAEHPKATTLAELVGSAPMTEPAIEMDEETGELIEGAQPEFAGVTMTYAKVLDGLLKAKNLEELDEDAALIQAVADEGQRKELAQKYDDLRAKLI